MAKKTIRRSKTERLETPPTSEFTDDEGEDDIPAITTSHEPRESPEPQERSATATRTTTGNTTMYGSLYNIPSISPNPFALGQFGQQNLGMPGLPFGLPTPGLWGPQYGYGQQIPGIFGQQQVPGIFGQPQVPGIFGQQQVPGIFGQPPVPGIFGQPPVPGIFGQPGMPSFGGLDPSTVGFGQNLDPVSLARLGMPYMPGVGMGQGLGQGLGMRSLMTPTFTIHSVGTAIVTPNIDPLAQLRQQFDPLSQLGSFGQNLGQNLGQNFGQFGMTPWAGIRPLRVFVLTPLGLIPLDAMF